MEPITDPLTMAGDGKKSYLNFKKCTHLKVNHQPNAPTVHLSESRGEVMGLR